MARFAFILLILFCCLAPAQAQTRRIETVVVTGHAALDSTDVHQALDLADGGAFSEERVERAIDRLLQAYEQRGFVFASVDVSGVEFTGEDATLFLRVEEGPRPRLARVELPGLNPAYAARLIGHRPGAYLAGYDAEEIRNRLERTGLYREVPAPSLFMQADSSVVIRVAAGEPDPGVFDLVLGYLPGEGGSRGSFVGSGHIELNNVMGAGRQISARLNRMPGQFSSLQARVADPYIAGLPFSLGIWFDGVQKDSTYEHRRTGVDVGRVFGNGIEAQVSVSREHVRPGPFGSRLNPEGSQEVARGDGTFLGIAFRAITATGIFPRRGYRFELSADHGRRDRVQRVIGVSSDTVSSRTSVLQDRVHATARAFVPVLPRQVLMLGADASLVASDAYDQSDLYYYGGAATLRGYDENRFQGRAVGRMTTEYRYRIEQASYAFVFFDLGFVERPSVGSLEPASGWYPGYGFGATFQTPAGMVQVTYAMSPEGGPTAGRVHFGLTLGL